MKVKSNVSLAYSVIKLIALWLVIVTVVGVIVVSQQGNINAWCGALYGVGISLLAVLSYGAAKQMAGGQKITFYFLVNTVSCVLLLISHVLQGYLLLRVGVERPIFDLADGVTHFSGMWMQWLFILPLSWVAVVVVHGIFALLFRNRL